MRKKVAVVYSYRPSINSDNYCIGKQIVYINGDLITMKEIRDTEEMLSRSGRYGAVIFNVIPLG